MASSRPRSSPGKSSARGKAKRGGAAEASNRAPYDAASTQSRRAATWHAPTTSPNLSTLYALPTLRDRSRAATRNNGYAEGSIGHLVTNIVGTGIKVRS
ncbi:MAG TPA: phage portal protein, partial [Vicinamibacterales bacterium]|nr:phage portal protein [Vicinamibacterales bacterium]